MSLGIRSIHVSQVPHLLALAVVAATCVAPGVSDAQPFALGTAFTYQGSLTDGATPANGAFDFEFRLWNDLAAGAQVGSTQTKDDVVVTQGVFTTSLDFGAVFDGERRWLEIGVRPGADTGAYTPLTPRVEISAAPHALYATSAGTADSATNADTLDSLDSTAFATPADIDWTNLANIPADFLDGTDDDSDANSLDAADGDPTDALYVDAFGNVGVGTTAPEAGLHVTAGPGLSASLAEVSETFRTTNYTNFDNPNSIALAGSVACVASFASGSLTLIDVSNPAAPTQLGVARDGVGGFTRLAGARGVFVVGTTAYVAAQQDNALTVVDISNPSSPALLGVAVDGQNGVTGLAGALDVVVSGTTAYVASILDNALCILDVSNPGAIVQLGEARDGVGGFTDLNGAIDVEIVGTTAYVTSQSDNALTILDVSNPASPQQLGVAKDGVGAFADLLFARRVIVDGTRAYVAAVDDNAVSIVDVSDPSAPALLGVAKNGAGFTHLGGASGLLLSGTTLFVTGSTSNAVTAVDVLDPSAPSQLGVAVDGAGGFTGLNAPIGITGDSAGLVYALGFQDNSLVILDPSITPLGLRVDGAAEITSDATVGGDLDVAGTLSVGGAFSVTGTVTANAFVGDGSALTNLPAANWNTMTNIPADFADDVDNVGADWTTNLTNIPAGFSDGTDDVGADWDTNLANIPADFADDVDNVGADWTTNLTNIPAGFADDVDDVDDADADATNELQTLEQVLTQGNDANGLQALDLGSVTIGTGTASSKLTLQDGDFRQTVREPAFLTSLADTAGSALVGTHGLVVSGNYAYFTSGSEDALEILDISNPAAPVHVGVFFDDASSLLDGALALAVSGRYAYVSASLNSALNILDVSNPAAPTFVSALSGQGSLEGLAVSGSYLFGVNSNGLRVYDVSNPASPAVAATLADTPASALDFCLSIAISGKYAYIGGNEGVAIVDVSNPTAPVHVGSLLDSASGSNRVNGVYDFALQGKYLYAATGFESALAIIDVSNPAAPVQTGALVATPELSGARAICVAGRYAHVGAYGTHFLSTVDISNPASPALGGFLFDTLATPLAGPRAIRLAGNHAIVACEQESSIAVIDLSGIDAPQASIGQITTTTIDAREARVRDDLHVGGGLNVSGGARIGQRLALGGGLVAPALGAPAAGTALVLTASGAIVPQTSSLRFKENVEPADLAAGADRLLTVQPVHFDYKESGDRTLGLIAEDLHAMGLTDLVNYDEDGRPWSIAYEKIPLFQNELLRRHEESLAGLREELARKDAEIEELRRSNADTAGRLARIEALLEAESGSR